ncbi:MAG TPA: hypothetical protein VM513_34315 [Kofleriaceae bacterium]|jgi:hypothetical protein|nr:hypothetical protein [Kofleriaceae bacterium]
MRVTCAGCGGSFDVAMPGEFRCEACAVAEVDAEARRKRRTALVMLAWGAALFALAAVMWMNDWNPGYDPESLTDGMGAFFLVGGASTVLILIALGMLLRHRPRLRR